MPSNSRDQHSASVVDLSAFRGTGNTATSSSRASAELLSLRQSLSYEASVEIDQLDSLEQRLAPEAFVSITRRVRQLLDHEFGRLRVHRSRRHFVARHRSIDTLIAGLLRAQFYAQQIVLPETDQQGDRNEGMCVSLTWGVGQTGHEAALERVRRRQR